MGANNLERDALLQGYRAPWDEGPRKLFKRLVDTGWLKPGRAIDLGTGAARNAIYLAKKGFDVTGVDSDAELIKIAQRNAMKARVSAAFYIDDLTNLQNVQGTFDTLVDYSTLDDLTPVERDLYIQNILPLTHPGSQFMLYCLEWALSWWEKLTLDILKPFGFGQLALAPGEVQSRFGEHFYINKVGGETRSFGYPKGYAVYVMTRKSG